MSKKIIFERKFRKTKQRIFISIIILLIANVLLGCYALLTFFHHPVIISPVPITTSHQSKIVADPDIKVTKTKELLERYGVSYQEVSQEGSTITIQLTDTKEAYLSSDKDLEHQIASLQLTINHFTIEGKEFKKLDFRFDKPIVIF